MAKQLTYLTWPPSANTWEIAHCSYSTIKLMYVCKQIEYCTNCMYNYMCYWNIIPNTVNIILLKFVPYMITYVSSYNFSIVRPVFYIISYLILKDQVLSSTKAYSWKVQLLLLFNKLLLKSPNSLKIGLSYVGLPRGVLGPGQGSKMKPLHECYFCESSISILPTHLERWQ